MEEFKFKKSLGQNFIYDKNLLNSFCKDAELSADDVVIEIGAGAGSLTLAMSEYCKQIYSFEIDKNLFDKLSKIENEHKNIKFIFADFLNYDLNEIFKQNNKKIKIIANIPYYITTKIIKKLINYANNSDAIYLLIQKEVADKFVQSNNKNDINASYIFLKTFATFKILRTVGAQNFVPKPKVDSAFVKVALKKLDYNQINIKQYEVFLNSAFAMRRKTLFNNLVNNLKLDNNLILNAFKKLNIANDARPEHIGQEKFLDLFNLILNGQ